MQSLAFHRQIETTLARAKETSRLADRMVTIAKEGSLSARRQLIRHLASPEAAKVFIDQIAPRLQDRQGGYTRVLRTGYRAGDGAQLALVEFSVPIEIGEKEKKPKKAKKPKPEKPAVEKKEKRPPKPVEAEKEEKKERAPKPEKEKKAEKPGEEEEKRGGFLSKLRKFLTGD